MNSFIFYIEMLLILSKDNSNDYKSKEMWYFSFLTKIVKFVLV